jgi:hypothetical protein
MTLIAESIQERPLVIKPSYSLNTCPAAISVSSTKHLVAGDAKIAFLNARFASAF